jgi:plasmid maintenance system antidote protein VapI
MIIDLDTFFLELKKQGVTKGDVADKVGVTASYLSKVISKEKPMTDSLASALHKNYGSVLKNLGLNLKGEVKERHIATRNHLKTIGESKSGIQVYESAPVQAGIKTVYHDEHQVPDYVLNIPQFRDCNYGTRASGDSMYPEVRNGDLIVCKELPIDARIIYGDMYVIHTKDGIETIKYVQQFTDGTEGDPWVLLVPHNKAAGMGTPIPRKEIIKLFKVRAIFKAY